mgnify:CR=1 FL=1
MLALPWLGFLTGCGKETVRVEYVPVPAKWLACAAEPAPPAGNTDKEVANFIISLIASGADCRNAVARIKDWNASQVKK